VFNFCEIFKTEILFLKHFNLKSQNRQNLIIITKVRLPTDPTNVNSGGASRNNLIHSVDESLERLQTNYIDILQLEGYDLSASISETVRHLDDLVTARKIAYFGVSDFKGWQLQKMIDVTRQMNTHKCVVASGEYNLLTRGCELEVCEVCRNEDLAFFGYAPLK
jgi:aryl-alcohol dehydrogenase-like predicted oxidoreductase